jgi:O-antigen/teichoic acid export membrane protein
MVSLSERVKPHLNSRRLGAMQILTGTAAGQALALAAAPVLSRLYSPADFGVFTVVSAVTLALATIFALRLDLAIPLPKDPRDAYSIQALAFYAITALTAVSFAMLFVFGRSIAVALGQPQLMPWLLLAPLCAAAMAGFMVLNQFAIRQGRFGDIGRRNILQSAIAVVSQVVIGSAGGRPGGLILGLGLGQAAGAASLLRGTGLRSSAAREGRQREHLAMMLRRYRRFPLILAPSGLLNTLGLQLPVVLMAYWYGSQVAGWLGLTQRVLSLPVMLLGTAVAQVYLAELAKAAHGSLLHAAAMFSTTSRRLTMVGTAVSVPLLLMGPWAFAFIFGRQWLPSGQYAQALSLSLAAELIASPLSQTLIVFERQVTQAAWDTTRLLATAGSVTLCALTGQSALTAVWAFSIASTVTYAASWFLSRRAIQHALSPIGASDSDLLK